VASVSSAGAGAGGAGVSNGAIAGIVGGAGAGVAATVLGRDANASIETSPAGDGILGVTSFTFRANGGSSGSSHHWDFGDGVTAAGDTVTHVYATEGTFQVSLTLSSSAGEPVATTTVTVGSLNGSWVRTNPAQVLGRLTLVQQGATLTGQWTHEPTAAFPTAIGSWPLTGTITSPRTVTIAQQGECFRVLRGSISTDLMTIAGDETLTTAALCGGGMFPVSVVRR
jgi:hypothetical protein